MATDLKVATTAGWNETASLALLQSITSPGGTPLQQNGRVKFVGASIASTAEFFVDKVLPDMPNQRGTNLGGKSGVLVVNWRYPLISVVAWNWQYDNWHNTLRTITTRLIGVETAANYNTIYQLLPPPEPEYIGDTLWYRNALARLPILSTAS